MNIIQSVESQYQKKDIPAFSSGDIVSVHVRVIEGEKERIQLFQGHVIRRRGEGLGATFTVRKMTEGVGVERIFPLHSPRIAKIEFITKGKARRSKLYFLRELGAKKVHQKTTVKR